MFKTTLLVLLFSFSSLVHSFPTTPYINIAPGHLCSEQDKDFSHLRYREQIPYCERKVSNRKRDQICALYGVYDRTHYTVDHIIPLSLGGSNHDRNLWCQHREIYTGQFEYWLYRQLDAGKMRQVEAVLRILSNKYNPTRKPYQDLIQ